MGSKPGDEAPSGPSGHEEQVRRQFTAQAAHFARQGLTLSSAEYLNWVVAQLPLQASDRVLDVAAGTGHLGRALAGQVRSVAAVDLTPAMIDEGRREAAKSGIANLRYVQGRAERLPLAAGSIDMVVTRLSLHHFLDPAPALAEMSRACRRGGHVAVMDMVSPDDPGLMASYNDLERLRDPSHTRCLALAELTGAMEAAGLTVRGTAARDVVVKLEPWMEMTGTPPEARQTIRAALAAELAGGKVTGMRPFTGESGTMFTQTWATVMATR